MSIKQVNTFWDLRAPHLQTDFSASEKAQRTTARYALNNYSWRNSVTHLIGLLSDLIIFILS